MLCQPLLLALGAWLTLGLITRNGWLALGPVAGTALQGAVGRDRLLQVLQFTLLHARKAKAALMRARETLLVLGTAKPQGHL